MDKFIDSELPRLQFSTIEAAKNFVEKLELENTEIREFLFLSNDETECRFLGYVILTNGRLFQ